MVILLSKKYFFLGICEYAWPSEKIFFAKECFQSLGSVNVCGTRMDICFQGTDIFLLENSSNSPRRAPWPPENKYPSLSALFTFISSSSNHHRSNRPLLHGDLRSRIRISRLPFRRVSVCASRRKAPVRICSVRSGRYAPCPRSES